MITLDRRRALLSGGGLILADGLVRADRLWAAPGFTEDPFALGVAAGDPWANSFVIWTRLAPRPLDEHGGMPPVAVPVRWEVAEDEHFTRIARSGEALARPELAHSVHVEVAGLQPGRPYWYRFTVDGAARSPVGMARTAPAPGDQPDRVRLVVAGCQSYPHGWYDAWRHIAGESDLDAVFHYGDYIYENGPPSSYVIRDKAGQVVSRAHRGAELYSLDDYRRRYAQYKSDPDLKAAHAAAAFIVSFDDHEVDDNWGNDRDKDATPAEAFLLRRFAAMQAWYEHMPVRMAQFPRADGLCMYRRLDYGRLLRVHVLDTRSYRAGQRRAASDKNAPVAAADQTILGAKQEAWLTHGLQTSPARWNLLAQQVRVMPLARRAPGGALLPVPTDTWSGFPEARARLVKAIGDTGHANVVIASGDAHMHNVGRVPLREDEPDGPAAACEFLASSISSEGDGAPVTPAIQAYLAGSNANLALANHQRGYQRFDIAPDRWLADIRVMDQVQSPGGTISTLAQFTIQHGRTELNRT